MPPGSRSQPWSVTTSTRCQPASSSSRTRRATRSTSNVDLVEPSPCRSRGPMVDLAGLGPGRARRVAQLVGAEHLDAVLRHQRSQHLTRRPTGRPAASARRAPAPGPSALGGTRDERRLRGLGDGRQGGEPVVDGDVEPGSRQTLREHDEPSPAEGHRRTRRPRPSPRRRLGAA